MGVNGLLGGSSAIQQIGEPGGVRAGARKTAKVKELSALRVFLVAVRVPIVADEVPAGNIRGKVIELRVGKLARQIIAQAVLMVSANVGSIRYGF